MRLIAANLQPRQLDDFTVASSIPSSVPKVRIDLVAATKAGGQFMAGIQDSARTGQDGDGNILVSPIERAVRIRTGEIEKLAG
jgi:nitrogen regulatory protein P-II 1